MMNLQKTAWRAYKVAARALAATRIVKLPMGNQTLGQRLGSLALHSLRTTLPNPLTAYGHTMHWDSRLSHNYLLECASGSYEKETVVLFQSLLHSGMTFADVGAHNGLYSLLAARAVGPGGKVYAFEPEPSNYNLLQKNIVANGYQNIIMAINKAISNKEGSLCFYLDRRDRSEGSLYAGPQMEVQERLVEATTLDNFFEVNNWPPVHIIKMDIEGAEKAALEGMRQLVSRNRPLKVIMEFAPAMQAAAGISINELLCILAKLNFQVSAIYRGLQPVRIPDDIPVLLNMAGSGYVNLFCEIK